MVSLTQFECIARQEWGGRLYYYESGFQHEKNHGPKLRVRFSDFAVMLNPNSVTLRNSEGDWLSFSGIKGVEIVPYTVSGFMLEFIPCDKSKEHLFIFVH